MDSKQIAAIAIVALLLIGAHFLLEPQEEIPIDGEYSSPFLPEGNTTLEEFAQHLLLAEKVCIVEDLRDLEGYPISRGNIMQCGVDFSGSEGIAGKELEIYVLEGEACTTVEGIRPISECYAEITSFSADPSVSVIWIEKGDQSTAYGKNLLVQVNELYSQGDCSVSLVSLSYWPDEELGEEPEEGEPEAAGDAGEAGNETESGSQQEPSSSGENGEGPGEGGEPPELPANDSQAFPRM